MKASPLFFVLFFTIFISACTNIATKISLNNTVAISKEILYLESLGVDDNLTQSDLGTLKVMIENDSKAMKEFTEISTMVKYGEYAHAVHGLEFLKYHTDTGKELLCPGHSLLHYYIFMKYNETGLAKDSLDEAISTLPQWAAMEYKKNDTGNINITEVIKTIDTHIIDIESNNTGITDGGLNYLDENASNCIG